MAPLGSMVKVAVMVAVVFGNFSGMESEGKEKVAAGGDWNEAKWVHGRLGDGA